MYGAHDVRVDAVPDARLVEPTDALVRVTRACICGSDLWPYNAMAPSATGNRMGHEFISIVESTGTDVRTVKKGDLVVAPFAWSDVTCEFCLQGLQTSCLHGGWWGEAVRVPQVNGTLVALPVGPDHALMPSLLTLSDVMGTGHYAALRANVRPGKVAAVVGDGAWVSAGGPSHACRSPFRDRRELSGSAGRNRARRDQRRRSRPSRRQLHKRPSDQTPGP